jgi:hypothetical protein
VLLSKPTSPEADLLLACARRFVTGGEAGEVFRALEATFDWEVLLAMAERHGVTALLNYELDGVCPEQIPAQLRGRFERQAKSNLIHTAVLARVLDLLDRNGIPAVPLKGPALAMLAYGDLTLRTFSDLDLLIPRNDVARAMDLLAGMWFRLESDLHWTCASACLRSKEGELSFRRESDGIRLDLHWRLLPNYFASSLDAERVWGRLGAMRLAGRDVPALSTEDLLLFLCAHGSKHRWECLGWLCDVALLVKRGEINWPRLLARAREEHIERMVLLGLRLAGDLWGSPLPDAVQDAIDFNGVVTELAAAVRATIFLPRVEPSPVRDGLLNLRMLERISDKLRFLRGLLITPTEAEWRSLLLPPALFFLYYPYRLARLTRSFFAQGKWQPS